MDIEVQVNFNHLPGAAAGYMLAGLSVPAMSLGGFIAGVVMAVLAGLVSRFTTL